MPEAPAAGAPDLEIEIDELVLHGFDPAQRHLLADHIAAALGPALADGGFAWAAEDRAIDRLDAAPVAVQHPLSARDAGRIGHRIAATVRGGT